MSLEALKVRNGGGYLKPMTFLLLYHHGAFSARKHRWASTWADGPGYYISRLWR